MMRRIMLAALLAIVLSTSAPAWAASKASRSNINTESVPQATDASVIGDDGANAPPVGDLAAQPALDLPGALSGGSDPLASFGPSSGTVVGNRAIELRDEVLRLRASVNMNANEFSILRANGAAGAVQYHSTVAAITARLQNGTTRGNPILLRQWDEADASLNEVTNSMNRLNALQTAVAADASLASYLLESVQAAFQLSGAVDEDHDQLKLLRDEVSRQIVQLDYVRNQVADDIQRQTAYLTTERANLQALAYAITRGEIMGNSLANRPVIVNPSPVMMMPGAQSSAIGGRPTMAPTPTAAPMPPVTSGRLGPPLSDNASPQDIMRVTGLNTEPPVMPTGDIGVAPTVGHLLVLIRFNQPNVDYEQQLSQAVNLALQHKNSAEFSVVGVTPAHGDPSELAAYRETINRNAEGVRRALVQLGMPPSRITLGGTEAKDVQSPEVRVYVR